MEWVETTGKSVEEATELALDQLGVLEAEAELEVLEEPRQGMFGRVRGNARVKARVRPSSPPPKADRQRKGRKGNKDSEGAGGGGSKESASSARGPKDDRATADGSTKGGSGEEPASSNGRRSTGGAASNRGGSTRGSGSRNGDTGRTRKADREPMPEAEQRRAGEEFLEGLLSAFGMDASVSSSLDADGILAFEIEGDQLGLLMGPGLNTLDAIQEVCRNSIQRQADGREYGKVILDVSGVRADRAAALEEFVRGEAAQVASSGEEVIFEVMSRTDRKIVHDVVSELDGVRTESVGEDPRRRVILRPA